MTKEYILPLHRYYAHRIKHGGWGYVTSFTNAFYPRILSLGYYSPSKDIIVVAKVFNWKLRLEHERGHANGLKHTWKIGYTMHPLGLLRGEKY